MNTSAHRTSDEHEELWTLLPWYANGTLRGPDLARVQAHLGECIVCRRDLVQERNAVQAFRRVGTLDRSAADGLGKLLDRVARENGRNAAPLPARRGWGRRLAEWLAAPGALRPALAFAAVTLAAAPVLWVAVQPPQPEPLYRTLAAAPAAPPAALAGDIHLGFAPQTTAADIQSALSHVQGTMVTGPNAAGVYTVRLAAPDAAAALAWLRAQPGVTFAEAVVATGSAP